MMKYCLIFFIAFITTFASASTSLNTSETAYIMQQINAYRASFGLKPVKTSDETCRFAAIRAKEISSHFSHDGFNQRYRDHTLPYKSWSEVNENIAMTSDYKKVVDMWAHSPGHAKNMRANTPYVCVARYGDYFAYLAVRPK